VEAQQGIAILKAREGYHKSALQDLEQLLPFARYSEHLVYHDFLNSYAVELTTAGRITEACDITKVILSSPFASAYPEWRETLADVRTKHKQRSIVTISQPQIERESDAESAVPNNPINRARVRAVIDFMGANLHRKIALPELAKRVNLSTKHFSYLFKAETGVAAGEYLIRLRMEKASQLLETSFLSIKQIMADVGYYNKSNFVRQFKRHFNVTPSEYRRRVFAPSLQD
jgi:AraC-like DNA-binding protein